MGAAFARTQLVDARVEGLPLEDAGAFFADAMEKHELAVVQAGRGAQAEHVPYERDPFHRQVLPDVALDQIGHRVGDVELRQVGGGQRCSQG
jgi:hypothetical protein